MSIMHKLIKAEFFKLRKSNYFKVLLLGALLYAITDIYFVMAGIYNPSNGLETLFASYTSYGSSLLLSGILAGAFIAGDFDNRILHSQIAIGNSRKDIFWAKVFVYWIASIIIVLFYQSVDTIGVSCLFGFKYQINLYELILLLRLEITYLLVFSGFVSICILIAFCFKSLFAVTAIEIGWIIFGRSMFIRLSKISTVINYIYKQSVFAGINELTWPFYKEAVNENGVPCLELVSGEAIFNIMKMQHYTPYILVSLMTILIIIAISYYLFKKTELK